MKVKKIILVSVILMSILTTGAVSASDALTNDIEFQGEIDEISGDGQKLKESDVSQQDEILNVNNEGTLTELKEIIDEAPENSTIILDKDYVYDDEFPKWGISIYSSLTIDGKNHVIDATNSNSRIFNLVADNIVLKNIIFKGGSSGAGGAISNGGDDSCITSCEFIKCNARDCGGAIFNTGDNLSIISCNFKSCSSSNIGGAIDNEGAGFTISSCTFTECSSYGGGAISVIGNKAGINSISLCKFIDCSAIEGGAIRNFNTNSLRMDSCIFTNCFAKENGGAVYHEDSSNCNLSSCDFINCHSAKKSTSKDGAVYRIHGVLIVTNCTYSDFAKTVIISSSVSTVYNGNKYLVATLKDSNGNPLEGFKVSVNLNGVKTSKTNKKGQIKLSTHGLSPKSYTAKITFNGNEKYAKAAKSVNVTVKKANPKITASAKTFKKSDKTKKYTITLKTNQNKVMKNTKVTLKVNGKTYSAKTNAKGQATFKITKLTKKGKFTAVVKFAGNKYYNAKTVKPKITIK